MKGEDPQVEKKPTENICHNKPFLALIDSGKIKPNPRSTKPHIDPQAADTKTGEGETAGCQSRADPQITSRRSSMHRSQDASVQRDHGRNEVSPSKL